MSSFKLIKALNFSEEEAAEFWIELDSAYVQDRAIREESDKNTGCFHTAYAVALCAEQPDRLLVVTKWLYPEVAKRYQTKWKAVERNIRTASNTISNWNWLFGIEIKNGICYHENAKQ